MSNRLNEIIAEGLQVEAAVLTDSSGPLTLDKWDSLRHLMIIHLVEDSYNVKFTPEEIEKATSVGKIRALLTKYGALS